MDTDLMTALARSQAKVRALQGTETTTVAAAPTLDRQRALRFHGLGSYAGPVLRSLVRLQGMAPRESDLVALLGLVRDGLAYRAQDGRYYPTDEGTAVVKAANA